jgi:hypothetical protein
MKLVNAQAISNTCSSTLHIEFRKIVKKYRNYVQQVLRAHKQNTFFVRNISKELKA